MVSPRVNFPSLLLSVMLLIAIQPVSYAAEIVCPPNLEVQEKLAAETPSGWNPRSSDGLRYLGGVTLFEGNPAQQVSLVPDADRKSKGNERIAKWKFVKSQAPIWLSCSYNGTGITFSRPLPGDVRSCTLIYAPGIVIKKISCQ